MQKELVIDALNMAVARRQPEAGLIHHTDQGSQLRLGFGQAAAKAGISRSMGSRGDCWDNAVAESFFATLKKKELIHRRSWPARQELRREVFDYIEIFYNATRRHSTLGMLSPARYEEKNGSLKQLNINNKN